MKSGKSFSIEARGKSFKYAFEGIINFFKTEHNAVLHLTSTTITIFFAIALHISATEKIVLVIVVGLVWIAELFNTAIEKMMDFISTEHHPQIKLIKDLSAAAVLISAVVAFVVGCIIFIPKL